MATRMMRVCDVCDSPATGDSLRFGWGSSFYETDLCDAHSQEMAEVVERVLQNARRLGAGTTTPSTPAPVVRPPRFDTKDVRAWAKTQGIEVNPKGRVPESLIQQYIDAITP